jgi:hypothetical protein
VPHTARHALPGPGQAALLPGLLILVAGGALAGMAALPGPASADSSSTAVPAAPAAALVPAPASLAAQGDAAELVQAVGQERRAERASRDRRPAPALAPPVVAPAPPPPPPFVRPGTERLTSRYGARWGPAARRDRPGRRCRLAHQRGGRRHRRVGRDRGRLRPRGPPAAR